EPIQTRKHIFTSCPTFENHRNILRTASEGLVISDLLGTEKGIKAVTEFLNESCKRVCLLEWSCLK
ncbi:hypothetical protein BKA83DRAFT_4056143, partial [Pisolithus microcarpus]